MSIDYRQYLAQQSNVELLKMRVLLTVHAIWVMPRRCLISARASTAI